MPASVDCSFSALSAVGSTAVHQEPANDQRRPLKMFQQGCTYTQPESSMEHTEVTRCPSLDDVGNHVGKHQSAP